MKTIQKRTLGFYALALSATIGLAGCASGQLSKSDCEDADYYELGYDDGKDGETADRLTKYTETCSREGVPVQAEKYNYGYKVGLAEYCDEDQAMDDVKDKNRDSICLTQKVPPYQTAYKKAIEEQREEMAEDVAELQEKKDELQAEQDEIQGDINALDEQQRALAE